MSLLKKENWTQKDIEDLISNNVEESIHLDFKSSGSLAKDETKRKEVCKDVSAFANSDGGIIIYGISEKNHKADSYSFLDGNIFTKEWLETLINTGIQRRIDDIRIYPIRFDNDLTKSVYVVNIPVSPLAPHMTKENRYYKRYNFLSVPMEEYEVRHTYERRENSKVDFGNIYCRIENEKEWATDERINILISFHVKNIGNVVADIYKIRCFLKGSEGCSVEYNRDIGYNHTHFNDGMAFSNSTSIPIFPDEEIEVLKFMLCIPISEIFLAKENCHLETTLFSYQTKINFDFQIKQLLDEFLTKIDVLGHPDQQN